MPLFSLRDDRGAATPLLAGTQAACDEGDREEDLPSTPQGRPMSSPPSTSSLVTHTQAHTHALWHLASLNGGRS